MEVVDVLKKHHGYSLTKALEVIAEKREIKFQTMELIYITRQTILFYLQSFNPSFIKGPILIRIRGSSGGITSPVYS